MGFIAHVAENQPHSHNPKGHLQETARRAGNFGACPVAAPNDTALKTIKDHRKNVKERSLQYTIEVVTPMFGGGVKAGVVDESMPVRVTEIRGHLRFWWRMLYGANLDARALFDAESRLWGNTDEPSKIDISVEQITTDVTWRNRYDSPKFGFKDFGPELYALYPAVQNAYALRLLEEGYKFCIEFRFNNNLSERDRNAVIDSLKAWVFFGGIGARTRKGCGSLRFSSDEQSEKEITELAKHGLTTDELKKWLSRLNSVGFYKNSQQNVLHSWANAIAVYKDFRQKEKFGRNPSRGRSLWPEADSLRKITGCASPRHREPLIKNTPAFPRAVMGLPMVFHFMQKEQRSKDTTQNEPKDCTVTPLVNGKEKERMASPIITKPLLINGKWNPFILILPFEDRLKMDVVVKWKLSDNEKEKNEIYGNEKVVGNQVFFFHPMQNKENAIESFIAYLKKHNWENAIPIKETVKSKEEQYA